MKKNSKLVASKGFTLIEMLIAVIVIGIVFSFVMPMLQGLKDKGVMVAVESSSMSRTFEQIYSRFGQELIDDTLDNEAVIRGRLVAEGYKLNGTGTIYNAFGGLITITGVADNGLEWESTKIPVDVCASLLNETRSIGFETVEVEGSALQYSQVGPDDMATECETAAGSNDEVIIKWIKTEI